VLDLCERQLRRDLIEAMLRAAGLHLYPFRQPLASLAAVACVASCDGTSLHARPVERN
jgi:hypothetical protein